MGPRLNIVFGLLILLTVIGAACDQPKPTTTESRLEKRAQEWASHISSNDWVTAYTRYAPDLMEVCSVEDLVEYQRLFLEGQELDLTVKITDIEIEGDIGNVFLKTIAGTDKFQVREIPTPNRWKLENGEWWYAPDEPEKRCVRDSPAYTPKGLGISQDGFMARFVSDVSDIYAKLSFSSCNKPLLDLSASSEEYRRQGSRLTSLIEQRLPRMQPVITYRNSSAKQPLIELQLTGERHALNQISLGGLENYFESDPCLGTRMRPYFIAAGKILAPEWDRRFDRLAWYRGEQGAVRASYTLSGDELPSDQFQKYPGIKIFVRYTQSCNPTDPLCPPIDNRWGMAFSSQLETEPELPPLTCESTDTVYYIITGEWCPGK